MTQKPLVPLPDDPDALLNRPQEKAFWGHISEATLWRMKQDPAYPRGVPVGRRRFPRKRDLIEYSRELQRRAEEAEAQDVPVGSDVA